jgi:predicted CXXCH cytochrome family protein
MIRLAANYRITVLLIASLLSLPSVAQTTRPAGMSPRVDATNSTHPVALDPNAPSTNCLQCHGDVQKGQYVHTALSIGCTTCHTVATENGVTHVRLTAPAEQMCVNCHVPSTTDKVLHGPYREGLCVACHSPHASDYPAHLWASVQDICMGCHTRSRLRVDDAKQMVTTPWGQTLTFAQMKSWQYLNLNSTETLNHPVAGHPVSGPNTSPKLGPLTCLSCHRAHGANYANLLPVGPLASMPDCRNCGLCKQCHANMY